MSKKGLGKGLGALITAAGKDISTDKGVLELSINEVEPNVGQPRKSFDDEKLIKLSESIKKHGIVQPIIVKSEDGIYRIVAGERRWRAARLAGLKTVPALVRDLTDKQVMEVALIENLQREDLNPIEEAEAYERLLNDYSMTQEQLSESIGKSRSAISNTIRLLGLKDKAKNHLLDQEITSGHARAILPIEDKELQGKICDIIIEKNLTVRQTENLVKKYLSGVVEKKRERVYNSEIAKIEENLRGILGTKVSLISNKKKGKIMIEYYSQDELERLISMFDSLGLK
ncbi:MAG: ParB/RepB/Spo0J family partition protein [Clostridium sp.]|nr:ParB/RepB/Spo0J family partition protein [Clostridium sp.]